MAGRKEVPKRLKKYRLDAGLTIYSLAERMNVNYSTVSYWENGIKFLRPAKMMELEDIFNKGYRDLFEDLTEEEAEEMEKRMQEQIRSGGRLSNQRDKKRDI